MAVDYCRGTIVKICQLLDKQNRNPKDRFVVLVSDIMEFDTEIHGVAITSTFDLPLTATSIELPYSKSAHRCKTGLNLPSVADCTWEVIVDVDRIIRRAGSIPTTHLNAILAHFT